MTARLHSGQWYRFAFCAKQACGLITSLVAVASAANAQDPATVGEWSARVAWPYKAIHAALLPTGDVIWWPKADNPYLWDPATATNTPLSHAGANIFCAGQAFLPDGKLLVAGGHVTSWVGLPNAYTFDPLTSTWTRLPDMNNGR
jgi:galactose oxidase